MIGAARRMAGLAAGALFLGACASEAEKAEERYELVANTAINSSDKCKAAEAAKAAWLADGDETEVQIATAREYVDCSEHR